MAGDWMKIRLDLPDDPAVIGMADLLDIDIDTVVGKLFRFWAWCNGQCTDGHTNVTQKWLNSHARCATTSRQQRDKVITFSEAMIKVGWLETEIVNGIELIFVPNWDRHNSESAKKRALNTTRASRSRSGRAAGATKALAENRRLEDRDKEQTTQQQQDRVVVLDLLSNEGITGKTAQRLFDGGATPQRVREVVEKADTSPPRDRTAWITAALKDGYKIAQATPEGTYKRCCDTETSPQLAGSSWLYGCHECGKVYSGATGKVVQHFVPKGAAGGM